MNEPIIPHPQQARVELTCYFPRVLIVLLLDYTDTRLLDVYGTVQVISVQCTGWSVAESGGRM